jgi:3-oxoacyl-[acyl-carrier-protein] synthase-3
MRWEDVYISSCATVLGQRELTADAVAQGRYDAEGWLAGGYESVCVAGDGPPVDMAVQAAQRALARSAVNTEDVNLLLHASCGPQAPDHVAAASYIQGHTVGGTGCALEIKQSYNGGIAALHLAAAHLRAESFGAAALVTTSDKFALPSVDRYRADPGIVLADGATGVVLSRSGGVARLLSSVVVGDGSFSEVVAFGVAERDTARTTFLTEPQSPLLSMVRSMSMLQLQSVRLALRDARLGAEAIRWWVCDHVGLARLDRTFHRVMGIDEANTTAKWGRTVGRLGAGDQVAGLTWLLEGTAVQVGDRVALCGTGRGLSYGCAIVEIITEPNWLCDVLD